LTSGVRDGGGDINIDQKMINTSKLSAFTQLTDKSGFSAEYGLTTAEQRDPNFIIDYKVSIDLLGMMIINP
jgi:hypothetical protein